MRWRKWLRGAAMAVVLVLGACSQKVAVGPEGRFSWEPQSQMVWPVEGAIVSAYGDAARPDHRGVDLAARPGERVAAAALGRAEFVGRMPGYGYVVVLSHGEGLSTVYAHLGSVRIHEGETVARGQTIGRVAAGGYLHYEIRRSKEAVDPATFYAVAPQPLVGGSVYLNKNVAAEPAGVGASLPPKATANLPGSAPSLASAASETSVEAPSASRSSPPRRVARSVPPQRVPPSPEPPPVAPVQAPVKTSAPPAKPAAAPAPVTSPPSSLEAARSSDSERVATPASPSAAAPPPAAAETTEAADSGEGSSSVGMGAAVIGANLVYMPAKFAYAGVGVVTGGMVLFLSHDVAVANDVWKPTLGGDYVVTERHLRGEAPLHFLGDR